jgi:hypothetical protein
MLGFHHSHPKRFQTADHPAERSDGLEERHIFISVGRTFTPAQEDFVLAVEDRLRSEGLIPHTVGGPLCPPFGSATPFPQLDMACVARSVRESCSVSEKLPSSGN